MRLCNWTPQSRCLLQHQQSNLENQNTLFAIQKKIPRHAYWLCKKDQLRAEKLQYFSGQKITNCISFSSFKSSVKNLNISHDCLFFFFLPSNDCISKTTFHPLFTAGNWLYPCHSSSPNTQQNTQPSWHGLQPTRPMHITSSRA